LSVLTADEFDISTYFSCISGQTLDRRMAQCVQYVCRNTSIVH